MLSIPKNIILALALALIPLSSLLAEQDAEEYKEGVNNSRVTTCRNNIQTICERCCWGYGEYVADATAGCPDGITATSSVIDVPRMTHIHYAEDWRVAAPSGSCGSCGGGASGSSNGQLPCLHIQRIHRYRDISLTGSLGPGVFLNYDINLTLGATSARVWDPRGQIELSFSGSNGTYTDTRLGSVKHIKLYDAANVAVTTTTAAAYAVLTNHGGETYRFEIIRIDPNPATATLRGRLVRYADRNDNAIVIVYNYGASATDADLGYDRNRLWQMASITDAYGRQALLTYQTATVAGRYVVTRIDLPGGAVLRYRYNNPGLGLGTWDIVGLDQVTLPNGDIASITTRLDTATQCQVVTFDDPGADGTHRRKDVYLTTSTWIDPVTGTSYSQSGRLVRLVVNAAGEVTYMNREGTLTAADPAVVAGYAQAGDGYVISYVGGNQAKRWIHRGDYPVASEVVKTGAFDPVTGWNVTAWEKTESYVHDVKRRIVEVHDNLGRTTKYDRESASAAPTRVTYPDGTFETTTYNAFKLPLRHIDRLGRIADHTYDAKGNLLTRTVAVGTPAQAMWSWSYNGKGQPLTATDANGNVTNIDYDSRGYLTTITEPADRTGDARAVRSASYDSVGRLETETDAGGRTVTYHYDTRNRLRRRLYADGSDETITYGTGIHANLITDTKDRNGNHTTFFHDNIGRPTLTTQAAGKPEAVAEVCTYLPGTDRKLTCTKAGETTEYAYDYRNRVVTTTRRPRDGVALVEAIAYDSARRQTQSTDAYGRRTFLAYDINDRVLRTVRELVVGGVPSGSIIATLPRIPGANPPYVIEEMEYDAEGQVTARIDGRAVRSSMAYDGQGRLSEVIEADRIGATLLTEVARTKTFYDPQGNVVRTELPRSFARLPNGTWTAGTEGAFWVTATYSGRNLKLTETAAAGLDGAGQPRPEKAMTRWSYSPTRKIATVTDARGLDAAGNLDPAKPGYTTTFIYGVCCDRLRDIIDPAGYITSFAYDFVGNRTLVSDSIGVRSATAYDGLHRPIAVTNGEGETSRIAYDESLSDGLDFPALTGGLGAYPGLSAYLTGLLVDVAIVGAGVDGSATLTINPAGEFSVEIRDGVGRAIKAINGLKQARRVAYDSLVAGLLTTTSTDALGHPTTAHADAAGRVRKVVDALNKTSTQGFDANGNRVTIRDANAIGQDCTYDARNRELSCTDTRSDIGVVRSRTYDTHGNVVTEADALLQVTTHTFDARDRRVATLDRVSGITTFGYDLVGNLLTIEDADARNALTGEKTVYTYDGRNLLMTETFPTGMQGKTARVYGYDARRRLTSRTVATLPASGFSELTTYFYDLADRLETRVYADGKNDGFGYDPAGRLTSASSARYGTAVTRDYDDAGRLSSETQTIDSGSISGATVSPLSATVGYLYDADGQRTQITYPNGKVVMQGYSVRHELTSVSYDGSPIANRAYDNGGRLDTTTYGNGVVETRGYVAGDQRVETIVAPGVTGFGYTYDANGRKLTETNSVVTGNDQTFGYDTADRLTTWSKTAGVEPAQTQSWTLSKVGDWTSTTRNGNVENRTHNAVHELTGIMGAPITYDAKGNLVLDDHGRAYTWDVENRLQAAQVPAAVSPTGFGIAATYRYDALGRRLAKSVNGRTTFFLHDGARVIEEITTAAAPTQVQVNGDERDGTLANAALQPASGGVLQGSGVTRINFQPDSSSIPAGFLADKGQIFGVRTNGLSYGWQNAATQTRVRRGAVELEEFDTLNHLWHLSQGAPNVWEIALPNGTYPVIVVCGDPVYRDQTNHLVIEGQAVVDPDPSQPQGYEAGDFDGYAVTATVTDGRLTIAVGAGAANPKICFVEIGAAGQTVGAATQARLADLIERATMRTAVTPAALYAAKAYVYGSYVDEVLAVVSGTTRSYVHSNHLSSPAAITNATGAVVERYRYDAYGKRTVTDASGAPRASSQHGFQRGFTGYHFDEETGLYYARERMYSASLGRFVSRDPIGYTDGLSMYGAYFAPNGVDPYGLFTWGCTGKWTKGPTFSELSFKTKALRLEHGIFEFPLRPGEFAGIEGLNPSRKLWALKITGTFEGSGHVDGKIRCSCECEWSTGFVKAAWDVPVNMDVVLSKDFSARITYHAGMFAVPFKAKAISWLSKAAVAGGELAAGMPEKYAFVKKHLTNSPKYACYASLGMPLQGQLTIHMPASHSSDQDFFEENFTPTGEFEFDFTPPVHIPQPQDYGLQQWPQPNPKDFYVPSWDPGVILGAGH